MSVAKSMSFYELPMFQKNWSIRKELLFLKALTVVGTENWVQIAAIVDEKETPQSMRDHYIRWYIDPESPTPSKKDLIVANDNYDAYNAALVQEKAYIAQKSQENARLVKQIDHIKETQKKRQSLNKLIPEPFGYNPFTQIFQNYIWEEAQLLLLKLQISNNQSKEKIQQRRCLLKYYNQVIQKRQKIQKQAIKRNLLTIGYKGIKTTVHSKQPQLNGKIAVIYNKFSQFDHQSELKQKLLQYQDKVEKYKKKIKPCEK